MTGSTSDLTCEAFGEKLMDFLEGDLDAATRAAMEAHVRRCTTCGALVADLRRITHEASALPALSPSRDLWSGVAARLEAPVVPLAPRRAIWKSPRVLGLAAAAAIVLAAGLGYEAARRNPVAAPAAVTPATTVASAPPPGRDSTPATIASPATVASSAAPAPTAAANRARLAANRAADATPAAVEHSYDAEINGLRAVITQRRSQLDSGTVAVLEHNLAVIDSAVAQCKSALAKDPHSQFLMQSLSQSLDTKVQLLRLTAGLPSAT